MNRVVVVVVLGMSHGVAGTESTGGRSAYPQGPARERLISGLNATAERFSPEMSLLRVGRVGTSDYTKLDGQSAHSVRASIGYARLLLEANAEPYRSRAVEVIRKVLSLQDDDKWSLTYGVWPYYAEEPLGKMFMADFNWAGFIGKELLFILIHQKEQLPPDVLDQLKRAIRRACESMKRRPLHMGYTNIASMNSYTLVTAGERLEDEKLLAHGRHLFNKWYDYTMRQGSFTEFNSPTYTRVAQGMTSRMLAHFQDDGLRAKAEELNDLLWLHMARRFHEPTRQWAGPHSRAYRDLRRGGFTHRIRHALDDTVTFGATDPIEDDVSDWRCPDRAPAWLAGYFHPLTAPRQEVEVFLRQGEMMPNGLGNRSSRFTRLPIVGTTYLHPDFALGTVNLCDSWEQHRNLMAHWGTSQDPTYMTLRCVNGGHGFCSAMFASVQDKGRALVGVTLITDHGNRYIDLDRLRGGRFKTRRLAVEFEVGGALKDVEAPRRFSLGVPLVLTDRGRRIEVRWLGGGLAGIEPQGFLHKNRRRMVFGVELYRGAERTFNVRVMDEAFAMVAVSVTGQGDAGASIPIATPAPDRRKATWGPLALEIPTTPLTLNELQEALVATVDGQPAWERARSLLALREANR